MKDCIKELYEALKMDYSSHDNNLYLSEMEGYPLSSYVLKCIEDFYNYYKELSNETN